MDPSYRYYIAKFYFFQLFKGIFFYCDGPQLQRLQIKNKDDCLTHSGSGHKWVNHKYNFDNLGKDIYIPSTIKTQINDLPFCFPTDWADRGVMQILKLC